VQFGLEEETVEHLTKVDSIKGSAFSSGQWSPEFKVVDD
jgi:hypothetical protein